MKKKVYRHGIRTYEHRRVRPTLYLLLNSSLIIFYTNIKFKDPSPILLTARDARPMERLMIVKPKTARKKAAIAIGKQASFWLARRALHRIGLRATAKRKTPALPEKNVAACIQFCKEGRN